MTTPCSSFEVRLMLDVIESRLANPHTDIRPEILQDIKANLTEWLAANDT